MSWKAFEILTGHAQDSTGQMWYCWNNKAITAHWIPSQNLVKKRKNVHKPVKRTLAFQRQQRFQGQIWPRTFTCMSIGFYHIFYVCFNWRKKNPHNFSQHCGDGPSFLWEITFFKTEKLWWIKKIYCGITWRDNATIRSPPLNKIGINYPWLLDRNMKSDYSNQVILSIDGV